MQILFADILLISRCLMVSSPMKKVEKYKHHKTNLDPTIPYRISNIFHKKRVVGIQFNDDTRRVESDYFVEDFMQENERLVGFCGIKD